MPPRLRFAQVNGALRLESFDAFMPPAVDFRRTVMDEHYYLLESAANEVILLSLQMMLSGREVIRVL